MRNLTETPNAAGCLPSVHKGGLYFGVVEVGGHELELAVDLREVHAGGEALGLSNYMPVGRPDSPLPLQRRILGTT